MTQSNAGVQGIEMPVKSRARIVDEHHVAAEGPADGVHQVDVQAAVTVPAGGAQRPGDGVRRAGRSDPGDGVRRRGDPGMGSGREEPRWNGGSGKAAPTRKVPVVTGHPATVTPGSVADAEPNLRIPPLQSHQKRDQPRIAPVCRRSVKVNPGSTTIAAAAAAMLARCGYRPIFDTSQRGGTTRRPRATAKDHQDRTHDARTARRPRNKI